MNWIPIILIIGLTVNQIHGRQSADKLSSNEKTTSGEDSKIKKPYQFGYEIEDGQGNMQHRHEQSDGSGAKVGSYGYVDANGIYRKVEYIADDKGFRVKMSSNEPGIKDINTPSISMVTKPYSSNDLESPSTPSPPVVPRPVAANDDEGMYNSLERESTRLLPAKSLDKDHHSDSRSKLKLHLAPKHHDYLYNARVPSPSSKEIVQQRPSSVYPHSLALKSSSDSHYSPPLKPIHSSGETNSLTSSELSYRSGKRPVVGPLTYSPSKSMEDKSKESEINSNNLNSIERNGPNSLPYSQYDPMKREKERSLNRHHQGQSAKPMKAPYELDDDHFRPMTYDHNQPSHSYPLATTKDHESMKDHNRFTSPSKWTKHEDEKKSEIIDKPIFPAPGGRYHHEPMSKSTGSMYLKNKPYTDYNKESSPSQLPSPPLSSRPYDYRESTSPSPPRPPTGSYLATELPLPPPPSPHQPQRTPNSYDSSHETQLPPPPSSAPPIHSSIYHVDEPSSGSHEAADFRERSPPRFASSSLPPFEPARLKSESYSDLLPLPPPSSSSSRPPSPSGHNSYDFHEPSTRKRPAAYPPRPETNKDETDSNSPQVIYDSRESASAEHGGRSSSAERHYPIDRDSDHHHHHHHHPDWYSVDNEPSRHPNNHPPPQPPPPYSTGGVKFNPKDESIYINKLPYDSMETQTKPTFPLENDFIRSKSVPTTINARYPRHKGSENESETINNNNSKPEKQLRGTSSEIYSNFKTGLRGLFNQINRDRTNPYTEPTMKNIDEQSTNHLTNQFSSSQLQQSTPSPILKSSADIIKKPKQLKLTVSSSEDTKQNAPVYRD